MPQKLVLLRHFFDISVVYSADIDSQTGIEQSSNPVFLLISFPRDIPFRC